MPTVTRIVAAAALVAAACQPTFQQRYGGPDDYHMSFVRETSGGNFVFGGDSIPYTARLMQADAFGGQRWGRATAASGFASYTCGLPRDDGSVLVAGVYPENDGDVWLRSADASGYESDHGRLPGPGTDRVFAIAETLDGGFILAGQVVAGSSEWAFLLRIDSSFHELWRQSYGGPDTAIALDVVATADEGFVFTGARGDPGEAPTAWLVKVDGNGTLLWQRSFEATYEGRGLAPLTSGGFAMGIKAGPGADGAVLIRTDPLGNEIWRQSFGDPAFELWHMAESSSHGFGFGGLLDAALHLVITDEAGNSLAEGSLDRGSLVHDGDVGFTATHDGGYAISSSCATVGEPEHDFCVAKTDAMGHSGPAPD